ncbi:MAG: hypothetical protein BWX71_02551 [Deltaproteobacteria bacterium ADurb.Bin072]|nr:MAG: hypothetical protein BWX71_02551 [Deltaproteobacteria bacterium ADurb.Bin072]
MMTCSRVSGGSSRGARFLDSASIQGAKKNLMKMNGRRMRRKTTPDRSTRMEKARPRSLVKVMSPKPRVDMTTRVQ